MNRQANHREAPRPSSRMGSAAAVAPAGKRVMAAMAELGYPVEAKVDFQYDPKLPIMGYSRPVRGGYRVVAGKSAVQGPMLAALLAHEVSHVQRMASGHASHNNAAIEAAYQGIRLAGPQEPYHEETVHDAINNVQDLYADGIAFKVMQHLEALPPDGIGGFFLAWMKTEPEVGSDLRESRWRAAHAMLGNARALSQIKAHGSPKQVREAEGMNARLLELVPADVAKAQAWFQAYLDKLPMEPGQASFSAGLSEYVRRFVAVAEGPGKRRRA